MSLPKVFTIKAAGKTWTVEQVDYHMVDDNNQVNHGCTEPDKSLIRIGKGEDLIDVFLHELVHVGALMVGHYDSFEEEYLVDAVAVAIRTFLQSNADFVHSLIDEIENS